MTEADVYAQSGTWNDRHSNP